MDFKKITFYIDFYILEITLIAGLVSAITLIAVGICFAIKDKNQQNKELIMIEKNKRLGYNPPPANIENNQAPTPSPPKVTEQRLSLDFDSEQAIKMLLKESANTKNQNKILERKVEWLESAFEIFRDNYSERMREFENLKKSKIINKNISQKLKEE
jgi:uncharacterized membrane protein YraQ (UPF0718 family)